MRGKWMTVKYDDVCFYTKTISPADTRLFEKPKWKN